MSVTLKTTLNHPINITNNVSMYTITKLLNKMRIETFVVVYGNDGSMKYKTSLKNIFKLIELSNFNNLKMLICGGVECENVNQMFKINNLKRP